MAAPEPGSELEQITVIVDALDGAIAQLDAEPTMAPVSQLALIGVAVLRAVAPLIRDERDRMAEQARIAAERAKVAEGKS